MTQGPKVTFTFGEWLTDAEITTAQAIGDNADALAAYFEPRMAKLNKLIGHDNDAKYMAYLFIAISQRMREG